ncbi:hypothetical protein HDU97_010025 [Phlyctochytrium planicorne]|nr:hypothetical protein HDU97_010025 [Phlyctochytrium planicorne]
MLPHFIPLLLVTLASLQQASSSALPNSNPDPSPIIAPSNSRHHVNAAHGVHPAFLSRPKKGLAGDPKNNAKLPHEGDALLPECFTMAESYVHILGPGSAFEIKDEGKDGGKESKAGKGGTAKSLKGEKEKVEKAEQSDKKDGEKVEESKKNEEAGNNKDKKADAPKDASPAKNETAPAATPAKNETAFASGSVIPALALANAKNETSNPTSENAAAVAASPEDHIDDLLNDHDEDDQDDSKPVPATRVSVKTHAASAEPTHGPPRRKRPSHRGRQRLQNRGIVKKVWAWLFEGHQQQPAPEDSAVSGDPSVDGKLASATAPAAGKPQQQQLIPADAPRCAQLCAYSMSNSFERRHASHSSADASAELDEEELGWFADHMAGTDLDEDGEEMFDETEEDVNKILKELKGLKGGDAKIGAAMKMAEGSAADGDKKNDEKKADAPATPEAAAAAAKNETSKDDKKVVPVAEKKPEASADTFVPPPKFEAFATWGNRCVCIKTGSMDRGHALTGSNGYAKCKRCDVKSNPFDQCLVRAGRFGGDRSFLVLKHAGWLNFDNNASGKAPAEVSKPADSPVKGIVGEKLDASPVFKDKQAVNDNTNANAASSPSSAPGPAATSTSTLSATAAAATATSTDAVTAGIPRFRKRTTFLAVMAMFLLLALIAIFVILIMSLRSRLSRNRRGSKTTSTGPANGSSSGSDWRQRSKFFAVPEREGYFDEAESPDSVFEYDEVEVEVEDDRTVTSERTEGSMTREGSEERGRGRGREGRQDRRARAGEVPGRTSNVEVPLD